MTETPDEPQYDLVMPFVTVASNGGPHDDASYAAGWEMGALDHRLAAAAVDGQVVTATILATNVEQADLIAMRRGYAMDIDPFEDAPEWTSVLFTPQEETHA